MPEKPRVQVFGPAYLDRVLVVDRPLTARGASPLDQSVDGSLTFGEGLTIRDEGGYFLEVGLPGSWPGPRGLVSLVGRLGVEGPPFAQGASWHDDLGGMGAGYASALGGMLVSALGGGDDPISRAISARLDVEGIAHRPRRVEGRGADWTLLVTSAEHGDKLPVGFRGCHAAVDSLAGEAGPCELRVVASLPNRLIGEILGAEGAGISFFAPAMRNMTDRVHRVGAFADRIDVLCCNRKEWESLDEREQVAWRVSILAITDGPRGCVVRYTTPEGEPGRVEMPAFPRKRPPADTNRAGEAFASALLQTLLDAGWTPGVTGRALAEHATQRGCVAAALVLDRERFGFPTRAEVDEAIRRGCVD